MEEVRVLEAFNPKLKLHFLMLSQNACGRKRKIMMMMMTTMVMMMMMMMTMML